MLTNLAHANDTYAERNNDVDSPLKTFAATLSSRRGEGGRADSGHGLRPGRRLGAVEGAGVGRSERRHRPEGRPVLHDGPVGRRRDPAAPREVGRGSKAARFPPARSASTTAATEDVADAAGQGPLGGRCCRACRPASTRCAAGRSTRRARPSRCPRPFRKSGHAAIESIAIKVVE